MNSLENLQIKLVEFQAIVDGTKDILEGDYNMDMKKTTEIFESRCKKLKEIFQDDFEKKFQNDNETFSFRTTQLF